MEKMKANEQSNALINKSKICTKVIELTEESA
jgi:hypothetical protein